MMPDSVAVEIIKNAPPDHGDVLLAVASLLVTALAALGAAWLGGWMAARSGRDAIRTEFEEERRRAQHTLLARMAHNLPRVIAACDSAAGLPDGAPIPLRIAEELEVLWNTYYRASEPIFTLGSGTFQSVAELCFADVHNLGVDIRDAEAARAGETAKMTYDRTKDLRPRIRRDFVSLRPRAEELLVEVTKLTDELGNAP
jgi:hypothetical protein